MRLAHLASNFVIGVAVCVLPLAAALGGGQIYKWVDEQGNVHYSDCPPPQDQKVEEVDIAPTPSDQEMASARRRLDALLAQQETSATKRRAVREARKAEHLQALERAVGMKRECAISRQNLHIFQKPRPVYSIDDTGEYIYYTDEERTSEITRLEQFIMENCSGG